MSYMDKSDKIVTGVEALDKKRYKVFLNNEFSFVLYKGELHSFGIEIDKALTESAYERIMNEVLPKRAKLRAMNLLKSRNYTERQLRDKLVQGFYPDEIVDLAIEYVKSYHYVDDEMYARDYITYHLEDRPAKRILMDLQRKGINKDVVERILAECIREDGNNNELEMIEKLLQKKHYDRNTATYEEQRKITAFLMRKGFSFESIRSILSLDIT